MDFLKTKGNKIIGPNGKPITLKGVNLGGWLMMEAYFMHSPSFPEQGFKKEFRQVLGAKVLSQFEDGFRSHFITEDDIRNIKRLGFNCMRVPFNYRLIDQGKKTFDEYGLGWIDRVFKWAEKYQIWVILDLHATYGCQNHDWHSDSYGRAELWMDAKNQKKTYKLWAFLADRYKDQAYLAGYDLLNESVTKDTKTLNKLYKEIIKNIRQADPNHILFVEGNNWATHLDCLDPIEDDNHVLSIHTYEPLDFTFNFVPHLRYPLNKDGRKCNKETLKKHLSQYHEVATKRNVPIFVGEFGVNYREGLYGEHKWLEDNLKIFKEFGFHWTYWTYKAIKNSAYPDGLYSYTENPPWVHREGPKLGWETFSEQWPLRKDDMMKSWFTENFNENEAVLKVVQKYAK